MQSIGITGITAIGEQNTNGYKKQFFSITQIRLISMQRDCVAFIITAFS